MLYPHADTHRKSVHHTRALFTHTPPRLFYRLVMASFANAAADSPSPRDDRLELHVRCVAGEEKVAVSVNLSDGSTIALNRCVLLF